MYFTKKQYKFAANIRLPQRVKQLQQQTKSIIRMRKKLFSQITEHRRYVCIFLSIFALTYHSNVWGQGESDYVTDELVKLGFENVRWTENENERIYSIENAAYKIQEVGITKAIETIQKYGLPNNKRCKIIVTRLDIPEISLVHEPIMGNSKTGKWNASYEIGKSWQEVKKEKKKNSSQYKVDILIYPQLSFQNMDITKVYQAMFSLNPAIEVSLWRGMKFTGQVILPLYVDTKGYAAYPQLYKKVRPGFITLAQRFRLPYNIKSKATIGIFNQDQYGLDLQFFRPLKDERFSIDGNISYTGWGFWDGFSFKYNEEYQWTWSLGANFYWPQYNVNFSLKAEQYLRGEKGVRFDMTRHFKYTSIGFYAMKAKEANSNGGFLFQVALPPYKQHRFKKLARINTSPNMGIIYNAGNERIYYKKHRAETSDKLMEENGFNPIYIENKCLINKK